MLEILNYLASGIIILIASAAIHIVRAEKKGYKALKWWTSNLPINALENKFFISYLIVCLIVWPIKVIRFLMHVSEYYRLYEHKNHLKD